MLRNKDGNREEKKREVLIVEEMLIEPLKSKGC